MIPSLIAIVFLGLATPITIDGHKDDIKDVVCVMAPMVLGATLGYALDNSSLELNKLYKMSMYGLKRDQEYIMNMLVKNKSFLEKLTLNENIRSDQALVTGITKKLDKVTTQIARHTIVLDTLNTIRVDDEVVDNKEHVFTICGGTIGLVTGILIRVTVEFYK